MNNKGFTIVELITTFVLSSILILILTRVILVIKNIYVNTNVKTEAYINQSILSNNMNKKFRDNELLNYNKCNKGNICYEFSFKDGSVSTLIINSKEVLFDNFKYSLKDGMEINDFQLQKYTFEVNSNLDDSILVIKIPIVYKLYPEENFGVNIIYTYNSKEITL